MVAKDLWCKVQCWLLWRTVPDIAGSSYLWQNVGHTIFHSVVTNSGVVLPLWSMNPTCLRRGVPQYTHPNFSYDTFQFEYYDIGQIVTTVHFNESKLHLRDMIWYYQELIKNYNQYEDYNMKGYYSLVVHEQLWKLLEYVARDLSSNSTRLYWIPWQMLMILLRSCTLVKDRCWTIHPTYLSVVDYHSTTIQLARKLSN
jgi:hypothetical protein